MNSLIIIGVIAFIVFAYKNINKRVPKINSRVDAAKLAEMTDLEVQINERLKSHPLTVEQKTKLTNALEKLQKAKNELEAVKTPANVNPKLVTRPRYSIDNAEQLLGMFGDAVIAFENSGDVVWDVSSLPASKSEIKAAFIMSIENAKRNKNSQLLDLLSGGYLLLADFQKNVGDMPPKQLDYKFPSGIDKEEKINILRGIAANLKASESWRNVVSEERSNLSNELMGMGLLK